MLNYVWLALLALGIGTALVTDISDQSRDKYRNGEKFPVEVILSESLDTSRTKTYDAQFQIDKTDFNRLYSERVDSAIVLPAKVTFNPEKRSASFVLTIPGSAPGVLQKTARAAGDENDVTGTLSFRTFNGTSLQADVVFESVSFLKLKDITNAALDYAGTAVNIAIGLIGIMALWLGVMKVAEDAGLIALIAKWLKPVMKKLFPDVPPDHPAMGSMIMNISANMLGLGNAATPFGLKAMEELDKLNPDKGTATNSMVTFLAINTAGLTLIPATAIAVRAAAGSSDPAIIIGTSIFGAGCATIAGITAAKVLEKFPVSGGFTNWFRRSLKGILIFLSIILLIVLVGITGIGTLLAGALQFIKPEYFKRFIEILSIVAIPALIIFFIGYGAIKKVRVYEQFVEGAKEGFNIAVRIIPYLVAMLMAIGIFRAGGAMDWLIYILKPFTDLIGMPAEALPMALMRPLSGSGSLGIMTEIIKVHGPDSFIGIMVSTFFGSTETTFYVLAVYFGAINIKNTRHALPAGLIADIAGILAAVFIVRMLFGH
ncbi:MAG TPA: nucleoside recognition domain-containing protein [Ignavibacteriaceae bacterium]|nr:nucleoside recognition domain-containing protein [Ignavibacteriaceae bacterium]